MYVIDASVFVSDSQPLEQFHTDCSTLLKRIAAEGWTIYVPAIMFAEVSASIARNTGHEHLAQRLITLLYRLPYLQVIAIDETFALMAANLAAQQRIRGCDAMYVTAAQMMEARLITLNKEQLQRSPSQVIVKTPAAELLELSANNVS